MVSMEDLKAILNQVQGIQVGKMDDVWSKLMTWESFSAISEPGRPSAQTLRLGNNFDAFLSQAAQVVKIDDLRTILNHLLARPPIRSHFEVFRLSLQNL